jgi:hypothetical protein
MRPEFSGHNHVSAGLRSTWIGTSDATSNIIMTNKFRLSVLFWIGLILFVVGSGPLLVVILLAKLGVTGDPNPNPIGFGILAGLTIWPSLGLIIAGIVQSFSRCKAAGQDHDS